MLTWEKCRADFEADGSLRDIFVLDTTIDQWRSVYAMLTTNYSCSFQVDGAPRVLPLVVDEMFAIRRAESSPKLAIRIGTPTINCYFFNEKEIELSFDPAEVASQVELDPLLAFLKQIGDLCKKPITVHRENYKKYPLMTYDADKKEFRSAD